MGKVGGWVMDVCDDMEEENNDYVYDQTNLLVFLQCSWSIFTLGESVKDFRIIRSVLQHMVGCFGSVHSPFKSSIKPPNPYVKSIHQNVEIAENRSNWVGRVKSRFDPLNRTAIFGGSWSGSGGWFLFGFGGGCSYGNFSFPQWRGDFLFKSFFHHRSRRRRRGGRWWVVI